MLKQLAQEIFDAAETDTRSGGRYVVAIAGPPASGKSTLSEALAEEINTRVGPSLCAVVPMDGFHLSNETLDQQNMRDRKGAIQTFDGKGFVQLIKALASHDCVASVPLFDRNTDAVIPDGGTVYPEHRILLVEGNYLLVNHLPWSELHRVYDKSIFLNPGIDVLKKRLIQRWLEQGYDDSRAQQRAFSNDIPNAEYVLQHSISEKVMHLNP